MERDPNLDSMPLHILPILTLEEGFLDYMGETCHRKRCKKSTSKHFRNSRNCQRNWPNITGTKPTRSR